MGQQIDSWMNVGSIDVSCCRRIEFGRVRWLLGFRGLGGCSISKVSGEKMNT